MNLRVIVTLSLVAVSLCSVPVADAREIKEKETIKSLERKRIHVRPGNVIVNSSDLARDNYHASAG